MILFFSYDSIIPMIKKSGKLGKIDGDELTRAFQSIMEEKVQIAGWTKKTPQRQIFYFTNVQCR